MRKRLYLVLLGLLSVWLGVAAQTGTDTRTKVTSVTATSNISELIGYGKSVTEPTITMSDGSVAYINIYSWEKKNAAGEWEEFTESTFTAGTYKVRGQLRIDGSYGTTHKLAENVSLTVDGKAWDVGTPYVKSAYSFVGVSSPEIEVVETYPINITNGRSFVSIKGKRVYVKEAAPGTTITISTVAPGTNMEFSNWEVVSRNTSLTDIYAKITTFTMPASAVDIKAVYVKKDVREEVKSVTATSDIADIIEYGNEKKKPTITLSEGSVAKLSQSSIGWQKKDAAGEWQRFEESTFTEGVYRVLANVSVDGSYGTTHKLADEWTMIVDGKEWTTERPIVNDTYSSAWITSPEIVVEKDEDPREKVKSVTATSDIADIIGYGKENKKPTFTKSEGSVGKADNDMVSLWKKNSDGEWKRFEESTFTEGTYQVRVQVRVDGSYGTTHRLADKFTLTVDGKEWETSTPTVDKTYSYAWAASPEIIVDKDPRTKVTSVTATSNIADIIKYGSEVKLPTVTESEGSVARISQDNISWWKQDAAGEWQRFEESTFTEGVYRARVQVRVDGSYGTTHKLADEWTLTIDGKEWETYKPFVSDEYSSALATSPDIIVEKNEGTREEVKSVTATSNIADIFGYGKEYKEPTITVSDGSVAKIVGSMVSWWKKDAAGEWQQFGANTFTEGTYKLRIQVSVDGSYGTTHKLADEWTLTIDGKEWKAETPIVHDTYSYAWANSPEMIVDKDPRTKVTSVTATSNISELIGYGKSVTEPTITMSDGSVAYIHIYSWEKKNAAGEWESFTESTFTAGTYKVRGQLRIDGSYGTTHKLAENVSLTVDGKAWNVGTTLVGSAYSYVGVSSSEMIVEKAKESIKEVSFAGMTKPVAGEILKDDLVLLGGNVDILETSWYVYDESKNDWVKLDKNADEGTYTAPYEEGKKYIYFLKARAKDGYEFASDLKALYNDMELPDFNGSESPNTGKMIDDDMLGIFILPEDMKENPVGIESAKSANDSPANIYNLQGILVKRNATADDFRSLPAGIYIMNGRKVIVK